MKKQWVAIALVILTVGFLAKTYFAKGPLPQSAHAEKNISSYWTCPMHPQIHLEHSGECPICHMKLVQVSAQQPEASESKRSSVPTSSQQQALLGVQKEQVERMDMKVSIPVSGRLLSSSSVAFQVYENDLRFIKSGLQFSGESSDGELAGTISSVDSIVDPTSRTVRVVGRIERGPKNLIPETTFSGVVTVVLKDRIGIPESSVLHTGTGDLVYVFTDGSQLAARKVILGAKTEGFYEVVSNLEPGEFISSGPNFLIDSEAKIRGTSEGTSTKTTTPSCGNDQHWDTPMSMCMPGKASK